MQFDMQFVATMATMPKTLTVLLAATGLLVGDEARLTPLLARLPRAAAAFEAKWRENCLKTGGWVLLTPISCME